jgi:hypothetical protein
VTVSFFLPDEDDLDALRELDPDEGWRRLQLGEHAWILQTYLRLAARGVPVQLVDVPPRDGLVVFHAKQKRQLAAAIGPHPGEAILVGVRADSSEALIADFEILQNGCFADGRRRFAVPHWPQPGLQPRDPGRGQTIRRVAYKGFESNLHPDLRSAAWRRFLAGHGLEWSVDAVAYAGRETDPSVVHWSDFRTVDIVVAIRPPGRRLARCKPATKLVNAWKAGVPAILGPEHGYRELRRSELDYLEAGSLDEARAAVTRLLEDRQLYRTMIDNGIRRASELTLETIADRWTELLLTTIPALAHSPGRRLMRRLPLRARAVLRGVARTVTLRPPR